MKVRSAKLARYLEETGALNGSPEAIARAKSAYRKAYKAENKKKNASKHSALRPQFTLAEYEAIKEKVETLGLTPTAFLKAVALKYDVGILPDRETLLYVLQTLAMATILLERESHHTGNALREAEDRLTAYLKNH